MKNIIFFWEKLVIFTEMSYFSQNRPLSGFITLKQPQIYTGITGYLNKTEWSNGDFWNLRTLHYRNTLSKS